MWIERGLAHLHFKTPTALTIGSFDGVHRGHRALLGEMIAHARAAGMDAVVLTFDPLPRQVFGQAQHTLLSTLDERLSEFEALGIDGVVILPFDKTTAAIPAADFVHTLVRHLNLAALWAGPDFALGCGRKGDMTFLRRLGGELGYQVQRFSPYLWRGEAVRSTRIREALQAGALDAANALLGRPYALTGVIVHGDGRGRQLGFPTANLVFPPERLLPAQGIYVCRACLPEGIFAAVTNIGTRPTFDLATLTVETYILDFAGDLYGRALRLDFLARLRDELRFASAEALIAQMRQDVADARAWALQAGAALELCKS